MLVCRTGGWFRIWASPQGSQVVVPAGSDLAGSTK